MRIRGLDTIRLGEYPNILWVEIATDDGLVGLGETFLGTRAVASYLHETAAPQLLGQDPTRIEHWARQLGGYLGNEGPGAETRGNSAVDIALWDLLGQATGEPLHVLLGGLTRESIRTYNTCAGPRYIRERPEQSVDNWGLSDGAPERYDDLSAFLTRAGELAEDLLEQGFTGMKIWPFDPFAEARLGVDISPSELERALEPVRRIRDAVGQRMDVMLEFHSLWNAPTAKRIARAAEAYEPFWLEDPVKMSNTAALADVTASTRTPVAGGETLTGLRRFRELLAQRALDVVIVDISWTGGLTEARKIAALAGSHEVPIAPHDCTGPVVLAASTHLSVSAPNAIVQEVTRASYNTWYPELVTDLPPLDAGQIRSLTGPGLGTRLLPGLRERVDAEVVSSRLDGDRVATTVRNGREAA